MGKLENEQHERFCQEYLAGQKFSAAILACKILPKEPPAKSYVYVLVDPRNDKVFYVGKGTGKRKGQHVKAAKTGSNATNRNKTERIREILAEGKEPIAVALFDEMSSGDALKLEGKIIKRLKPCLTNGLGPPISKQERAKVLLSRIVPFEKWKARNNPNQFAIDTYWLVKRELEKISIHGYVSEFTFPSIFPPGKYHRVKRECYVGEPPKHSLWGKRLA